MIAISHMWLLRFELIKNRNSLVTLATFQAPNSHPHVSSGYHILHGTEAFLSSQKILSDSVAQAVMISVPFYGEWPLERTVW